MNGTDEILIATGTNFADSLSASATGLPIVLVGKTLSQDQKDFLATSSRKFVIIGGTGAVSEAVEAELAQIGTVERIKGKSRYETSVVIAERYFANPTAAILAYAQDFPDGLCGGPLAYKLGAPLILTSNTNYAAADAYIEGITSGAVTGGTARLTDKTVREIFDLADDMVIPVK
jgi:putative cell wall-binding protein